MIVPNKFISFDSSILRKIEVILGASSQEVALTELYKKTERHFDGIDQFLFTMDVLHVLGRIDIDFVTKTVKYAD